jgi:hypothetical protein
MHPNPRAPVKTPRRPLLEELLRSVCARLLALGLPRDPHALVELALGLPALDHMPSRALLQVRPAPFGGGGRGG